MSSLTVISVTGAGKLRTSARVGADDGTTLAAQGSTATRHYMAKAIADTTARSLKKVPAKVTVDPVADRVVKATPGPATREWIAGTKKGPDGIDGREAEC
jgi:hypothetical protein